MISACFYLKLILDIFIQILNDFIKVNQGIMRGSRKNFPDREGGGRGIILCSMGGGMMPIFENFNTLI